ncbi:WYL domain-containing protein [Periweissella cryptocerci]|uniref:WYL domain-containing protein n=1 Tax=Periweissella cryptocerci TaxID=2506420 RepID=A0A4V1AIL0_9LACO|nr:WYL domain-containing protein [Periweissella cryptocerci]QBO35875.1 WYL domain-containing protein [Periweissella cryptocerci]
MAKKAARLAAMTQYVNHHGVFHIADLMREFDISRSTALRSVAELQAQGLPITSELGANGGYRVASDQMLPPTQFTLSQVKALYLALWHATQLNQPFQASRETLMRQLADLLVLPQQQNLLELQALTSTTTDSLVVPESVNPELITLQTMLELALQDHVMSFTYQLGEPNTSETRHVAVTKFYQVSGHWFLDAYDFDRSDTRTFRVSAIVEPLAMPIADYANGQASDFAIPATPQQALPNVTLTLTGRSLQKYYRFHLPQLQIINKSATRLVVGTILVLDDAVGLREFAEWVLYLGDDIHLDGPSELISIMQAKLDNLT